MVAMLSVAGQGFAQAGDPWQVSTTIDGQPDLQGVWANNTITPVERHEVFGDKEFLTDEDLVFLEQRVVELADQPGDALFGNNILIAAFTGEIRPGEAATGSYDQQWMAARSVHRRTAQIIDPPNGKYPPRTEQAIATSREAAEYRREHPADSWLDRSLGERCLSFGAPFLSSGYNSYWQIVQSRDHVVVMQEMVHDARIIPLVERPALDDDITLWHDDSRGYWDGDTLVIETSNFSEKSGAGPDTVAKVTVERLTRTGESQLQYQLTTNDPGSFTAPYTREIIFDASPDAIYEYACHEGNYGMQFILSGHRAEERFAREGVAEN
jgi:hypothetical protein